MQDLRQQIMSDLELLGLPLDFNLDIRGYSKAYNGRYDPNNNTIILYTLEEDGSRIDYDILIQTVIHESIHHYQWVHDPYFVRLHGVMHNDDFKRLEVYYVALAIQKGVIQHCYLKC